LDSGFMPLWNLLRNLLMHGEVPANDTVERNWGSCCGPLCKTYTLRCNVGFCQECCEKAHYALGDTHYRPWVKLGWTMTKNGKTGNGSSTSVTPSNLPAVYQPKPAVPEPEELVENTADGADWTMAHGYGG